MNSMHLKDLLPSGHIIGWPWPEKPPSLSLGQKNAWPRVTLVTPCFNSGDFLEEAIRSVLLQGYPNLEYIIIDGGSSDQSVDIIRKYEQWLTCWESNPDRGQSHAINKGLAKATGVYFNWHNADDILLPDSLFQTVQGFIDNPDALYISRHRFLLYEDGRVEEKKNRPNPGLVDESRALIHMCAGSQAGGLMSREAMISVGSIDESYECSMDDDLLMRLRIEGPGYYIDKPGFIFRVRKDQKSQKLVYARAAEKLRICDKIWSRIPKSDLRQEFKAASYVFAHQHAASLFRNQGINLMSYYHSIRSKISNFIR